MPVQTKICGLTTAETLDAALKGGASHVGFVFFENSPRNLSFKKAEELAARVPGHVRIVGVFVQPDPRFLDEAIHAGELDVVQLHGDETPEQVDKYKKFAGIETWKALSVRTDFDLQSAYGYRGTADRILYDAKTPDRAMPGGMGLRFDWALLESFIHPLPWALSGGLDARNISEAVRITDASLLDVSSGVESAPGIKDVDKIAAFLKAASTV